jgi:hypothetical protein
MFTPVGLALPLLLLALALSPESADAACTQADLDGSSPPTRRYSFRPKNPLQGFYQWHNNNGYCGEASLIQSGLALGQWTSQYSVRSVASPFAASIAQTGTATEGNIKFLSQLLLDDFAPRGTTTGNSFGTAAANLKLVATPFNSALQKSGSLGHQAFLTWVKAEVIKGNYVTLGVIHPGGGGPYSHIVNVIGVDSNAPATSTAYNGSDVLILDDHGLMTSDDNPQLPLGAGGTDGCTPYRFAYTFDSLKGSPTGSRLYQIPLPGTTTLSKNYAYSISGVADTSRVTLPVRLAMSSSIPADPIVGQRYESPAIGTSTTGESFTNRAPAAFSLTLTATVSGLVAGKSYNLYRYQRATSPLPKGQLVVPSASFNANARMATNKTAFQATGSTYVTSVTVRSTDTVVFRCVPVSAP